MHTGVLMSLKLFNKPTQENVISSIGAETVSPFYHTHTFVFFRLDI
jgi:hypothetical protein